MPHPARTTSGPSTVSTSTPRPVRPICRYVNMPGGCYAGAACKFRHSEAAAKTPHQEAQICKFYAAGYCKRGAECWFKHVSDAPAPTSPSMEAGRSQEAGPSTRPTSAQPQDDDDDEHDELACMICYEKPLQYGLLAGCSHVFCLTCMRGWRDIKDKEVSMLESGVVKACPVCRVPSRFITPSSQFYPEGHPKKQEMIGAYKSSMARVPCRYFARSLNMNPPRPYCPYGKDCFYGHKLPTGVAHVFPHGADYYMTLHRDRSARRRRNEFGRNLELLTDAVFTAGMAGHSGADIRRELEQDGFWRDLFAGFGWDMRTQGNPIGVEGPLPPPPGPGRSFQEMNSIRHLLNTLASNLNGNYLDDFADDDDGVSGLMDFHSVGVRLPATPSAARLHHYFGPRPPSPHPVATRSTPASESGHAELDTFMSGGEGEGRSARAMSTSRRSSYYGPRPPSPHPTAARSTPASVHGGEDELPGLATESDSEELSSDESEDEDANQGAAPLDEVRAARRRFFGPTPPPRTSSREAGVQAQPSTAQPPLLDAFSSESELSESEDDDSEDDENEDWRDAPSPPSPTRVSHSSSPFSPQTLEHAMFDHIRARIRSVPDGAASRPVIPVPRIASSSRGGPDASTIPGASPLSAANGRSIGDPPRPPYLRPLMLSTDLHDGSGPSAAQEEALGNLPINTSPNSSLAARLISGLFRRDAAQERRAG